MKLGQRAKYLAVALLTFTVTLTVTLWIVCRHRIEIQYSDEPRGWRDVVIFGRGELSLRSIYFDLQDGLACAQFTEPDGSLGRTMYLREVAVGFDGGKVVFEDPKDEQAFNSIGNVSHEFRYKPVQRRFSLEDLQ